MRRYSWWRRNQVETAKHPVANVQNTSACNATVTGSPNPMAASRRTSTCQVMVSASAATRSQDGERLEVSLATVKRDLRAAFSALARADLRCA